MAAGEHLFDMRVWESFLERLLVIIAVMLVFAEEQSVVMRVVSRWLVVRIVVDVVSILHVVEDRSFVRIDWVFLLILLVERHPLIGLLLFLGRCLLVHALLLRLSCILIILQGSMRFMSLIVSPVTMLIVQTLPVESVEVVLLWALFISVSTLS